MRRKDDYSVISTRFKRDPVAFAEVLQVNTNTRNAKIRLLGTNQVVDVNLSNIDPDGVLDDRAWLLVWMATEGSVIPIAKVARKLTDSSIPAITLGDKAGQTKFCVLNSQRQPVWCVDSLGRMTGTLQASTYTVYGVYHSTYTSYPISTYGLAGELSIGQLGLAEGPHIGLYNYVDGDVVAIVLDAADTANVPYFSVGVNNYEVNSKWFRIGYADAANISMASGSGGSEEHTNVVVQTECLEGADDGTLYIPFGDQGTDGSWRVIRDGNNLVHQRREAGSWVTKHTITP